MADGGLVGGISERLQHVAATRYAGSIKQDAQSCSGSVILSARYGDNWSTPMAGAKFRLLHKGKVIEENRLKSLADIGKRPGDPLTAAEYAQLGTFEHKNAPSGDLAFELTLEEEESAVIAKEEALRTLIQTKLAEFRAGGTLPQNWAEWNNATSTGKAELLLSNSFDGFVEGMDNWFDEEGDFWSMIGETFSKAWDSIVEGLGELATALHPDNIGRTAEIVWEAARATAQKTGEFVRSLPGKAQKLYAGTMAILNNIAAITKFIGDFMSGNWDEIEHFCRTTLLDLIDDPVARQAWTDAIMNNAENWQMVLEVVGFTNVPKHLLAFVSGLVAAIPPHVWARWGAVSVAVIAIELSISAIITLICGLAEGATVGGATAIVGPLLAARAAKWAKMGGTILEHFRRIIGWIDNIMEKVIELARLAVKARRRGTIQNSRVTVPPRGRGHQRRDQRDDERRCRNCGAELGKRGHPAISPNFPNGNTSKDGSYRSRIMTHTLRTTSSIGSTLLVGDTQAHHLVSAEGMKTTTKARNFERLGYQINVVENLSLIPSKGSLACHLKCQLHRSDHRFGGYNYHIQVAANLALILANLSKYCKQGNPNRIQPDVDRVSARLAAQINIFTLPLTSVARDFAALSQVGCANVDSVKHAAGVTCSHNRNHAPGINSGTLSIPYMIRPAH
ncbi:AHH domain-containing protein [Paracoccus sulfuroxidans]|uniref:HNH/ENDO VII superfamily nuclease n=1 Tax=Paracoccus sulfuroxidans TaxID=384678 RepID=A0A562NAU7_9RHOB|nr:AHH domain-containing protein [Paracoccus sulfuroxidans]TWI29289.1 HNH/ENDO VII superfamily nuclease [Paracoccus sulfuroxidans]